ncbi:MAG TPA: hypothetical protein VFR33_05015 [Candidatus Dormibacteraeota bacterium]|nr:hypothetical protein [Candidatus Dormibacteraeota bacterium]
MNGLDAVREHHLAAQRARAKAIVTSGRESARQMLAQAESDSRTATESAEREGEASADLDTNREWTAARRRARGIVLAAQRAVYEELSTACADAITTDSRYPALQRRVADAARAQLGPGADVYPRAAEVIATRKQRSVRWTLAEEIAEELFRLHGDVEALWR